MANIGYRNLRKRGNPHNMKIYHIDETLLNPEATCKQAPTTSMELFTKCCVRMEERTGRAVRFKFYSKPLDRHTHREREMVAHIFS